MIVFTFYGKKKKKVYCCNASRHFKGALPKNSKKLFLMITEIIKH